MNDMLNAARRRLIAEYLTALRSDTIPWQKPWKTRAPRNAVTGRAYKGINHLLLDHIAKENGWQDPRWCTFLQAKEQGWRIYKGEHAVPVEYWFIIHTEEHRTYSWEEYHTAIENGADEHDFRLRTKISHVFNAAQLDGIAPYLSEEIEINKNAFIDGLIENMEVDYVEIGDRACYVPAEAKVMVPPKEAFLHTYAYHSTRLHELCHASGHEKRLARDLSGVFGSEAYAKEELRAEIGSSFLMQDLGLSYDDRHSQQHMAYVQNWISVLEKDPNELFRAIRDAEEITGYIKKVGGYEQFIEMGDVRGPELSVEAQDPIFSIALHRLADDAEVWLDLPAGDKEIEDTMRSLGIAKTEEGGWYREAFDIPNHDGYPFYRIDPHEDIMTLNVLAKQLSMLNERQLAGLICYADTKDIFQNEALTILSLHADDIPYFTYDHELMQSDVINDISLEERYGMTKAIDTGLMKKLDELQIITYFDFKSYGYGDICNGRVTLYEEGFIDDTIRVSLPETFTEAQVMITDAYEHRYSIAGTDPVSAERLCADIDKLIHRYPDIRNLHYDLSSDHMSFLYEDRSVDVSLSDILERKNGFEQFLVLQPGETNEGCLERSYRKLVAMSDLLEEEQELFLERKEDIRIAGISI